MKVVKIISFSMLGLGLVLILLQLKRVELTNPSMNQEQDMIFLLKPSKDVEVVLRKACYDCHSNQTRYPWYAQVAPVSWMIARNVKVGREEINFSEWGTYRSSRAMHKLEESYKQVKYDHMPLPAYSLMHSEARLTNKQRDLLQNWFEQEANLILQKAQH